MSTFESLFLLYWIISILYYIGYVFEDGRNNYPGGFFLTISSPIIGPFFLAYSLGKLSCKSLKEQRL